jgi:hypothetical protein
MKPPKNDKPEVIARVQSDVDRLNETLEKLCRDGYHIALDVKKTYEHGLPYTIPVIKVNAYKWLR